MTSTGNASIKFEVKSPLAKLLASENITFRHQPGAKTAYFDVKNRVLVLPVWENITEDLYDMLIVHEVGHALDTPADDWVRHIEAISRKHHGDKYEKAARAVKDFMNVIEDARIDKRQKRRFPGSRRNYTLGYRELLNRNFFGTEGRDVNSLPLIDRINLYFKGGAMMNIKFSEDERKLVNRIADAETFDDVIGLTDEVYAYAKAHQNDDKKDDDYQDQSEEEQFEFDEDAEGFGTPNDSDDYDEEESDGDEAEDEAEDDASENDDAEAGGSDDVDAEETEAKSKPDEKSDDDFVPESETEQAAEQALSSIVRDDDVNYVYITLPKMNVDNIVDDYPLVMAEMAKDYSYYGEYDRANSLQAFNAFRKSENETISFMVKEFEMRKAAETYARASTSKTGVLNTNKLHSYQYNEDIFRKLTVVPNGKNHGFVMLLDWSGSMLDHFGHTLRQLFSLTMFCKRVQIPFEVYAFNDRHSRGEMYDNLKPNDLVFAKFRLRNILSSRMNMTTLNKAYEMLWYQGRFNYSMFPTNDHFSSTPLNQAILAADVLVNRFRAKYKLEVVNTVILTDGAASCSGDIHGFNAVNQPIKKGGNRFFLADEVTKKQYDLGRSRYSSTHVYLRILKDRTQSNILGFFVTPSLRHASNMIGYDACMSSDNKKSFNNDGFLASTSGGYDEFYVLNVKQLSKGNSAPLEVNKNMSKNGIAKAFAKFSKKKAVNRVMLTKFITRVCTDNRKAA